MVKIETIYNKVETIERCIKQIKVYANEIVEPFEKDFKSQDAIILNIQRACEASIDLAMHICAKKKLGLPKESKEVFVLLEKNDIISSVISKKMQAMVGFRNVAIHEYQSLNLNVVRSIINVHLTDFKEYSRAMIEFSKQER